MSTSEVDIRSVLRFRISLTMLFSRSFLFVIRTVRRCSLITDFPIRFLPHPGVDLIIITLEIICGGVNELNPLIQRERAQASFSEMFSIKGNIILY